MTKRYRESAATARGRVAKAARRMALALVALAASGGGGALAGDVARGAYLASIMDCMGCHSGRLPDGRIDPQAHLTGGTLGFEMPGLGIFYPYNLTPDSTTALGQWSEAEMIRAICEGIRPDGRILAPIMPYGAYAALTAPK